MNIGIGSYCLTWSIGVNGWPLPACPMQAIDLLDLAISAGADRVQLADNLPLDKLTTQALHQLADKAEKSGMPIEIGLRGSEPERLLEYLSIAGTLKAGLVRTLLTERDLGICREHLSSVLPLYAAAGVTLALENHGLHSSSELAGLIDGLRKGMAATEAALIGCCLDTVNSFGSLEGPEPVIRNLAPLAVNLHLKDFTIRRHTHQMGFEIIGTPAGKGRLDIPALLKTVRESAWAAGRQAPGIILELWVPWQGDIDATIHVERQWLAESLEWLHELS